MGDRLLEDVLGPEGAAVLARAAEEDPTFADALRPRAALAWARLALAEGFDGFAPGRPDIHLLVKAEGWTATLDGSPVSGRGEARLTALLLTLVEAKLTTSSTPSPVLERLGKNLDALAGAVWNQRPNSVASLRARARKRGMAKAQKPSTAEAAGPAAAAMAPEGPQAAQAPQGPSTGSTAKPPAQPKAPKAAHQRPITLRRSELEADCGVCGRPQVRHGQLVGCICWSDLLAKSQIINLTDITFVLRLPSGDPDASLAFLEAVRRG